MVSIPIELLNSHRLRFGDFFSLYIRIEYDTKRENNLVNLNFVNI